MLLFFIIFNVIFACCLLFIEITFNKLTMGPAFLKMFGFLIVSVILSFLINHYINPHQSFKPPKNKDNQNNENNKNTIDEKNTHPDILKSLQKSMMNTGSSLHNTLINDENFFSANKNMFSFFDIFTQLFKENN